MKRITLIACCLALVLMAVPAMAVNSVVVESRTFGVSQVACSVGVFITNDVDIQGLVTPFEIRSATGGSYILTSFFVDKPAANRLGHSPLEGAYDNGVDSVWPGGNVTDKKYAVVAATNCSTVPGHTYATAVAQVDFVSPDAAAHFAVSTGDPGVGDLIFLSPGTDPAGTNKASIRFRFGVNASNGTFEIDTCCVTPANHLVFVDANVSNVTPTFTKGVETVGTPPPPNTPPIARCKNPTVNADGNCQGTATAADVNNGSSDNEDPPGNLTLTLIPAGPYALGVTPVKLRVTDTGGLKDSCNATVTVVDVTKPIIACPGNDSVECQSAVKAAATNLAGFTSQGGTASDNCGPVTITFQGDIAAGSCPRTITRTYRATDGAGNFAECTQKIIVHDVTKPTITSCPKDTVVTIGAVDPLPAVTFTVTASDNCGVDHITCTPASGATFPEGPTVVKCVAVDSCGNKSDTCKFTVTVNRQSAKLPPIAKCKDVTVNADANCQANASIDDGSNDPDGGAVTLAQTPAGPYSLGTTKVTLHVTDDEGDTASCSGNVKVEDHTPPTVVCTGDFTVPNSPGQCGAAVDWPAPKVTDNCSGAQAVCIPDIPVAKSAEGWLFPIGKTKVQCIATDGSGNKDTCEFFITVNDTTKPQIICPQDIKVANDLEECHRDVSWTDPIPTDNCPGATAICKPASGSIFDVGVTTVWCVATDASGNKDSCSFTVTVNDTQKPSITCPGNMVFDNDPGQCGKLISGFVNGATASDNCPGVVLECGFDKSANTPGLFLPIGTTFFACRAKDAAGNYSDYCGYTITIKDAEPPVIQCPDDIVVTVCPYDNGGAVFYKDTINDNCPGAVIDSCVPKSGSFFPLGTTEVCCYGSDASGNTDKCCFKVTVVQWHATPDQPWITAQANQGSFNSFFDVFADVNGLTLPGEYKGTIYLTEQCFNKGAAGPSGSPIGATPDTLYYNANIGGPNPPKDSVFVFANSFKSAALLPSGLFDSVIVILTLHQNEIPHIVASVDTLCFNILAGKNDTLCKYFTLSMSDQSQVDWCFYNFIDPLVPSFIRKVDPTGGTTPSKVTVCVDPCEWEPGTYYDTLLFCPWKCDIGNPKDARIIPCAAVIVCLNVINSPALMINKTGFVFHVPYCEPVDPQKLGISNLDGGDLIWSTRIASCDPPAPAGWLTIDPSSGTGDTEVDLKVNCANLPPPQGKCDTLCDTIEVSALCARYSPQYALCTLIVCPPPPPPCGVCGTVITYVPIKSGEPTPVDGACVQIWTSYPDGELIATDTTDEKGGFCIRGLDPEKTYDLRVYAKGYCPEIIKVKCGEENITVTLHPLPFVPKPGWPYFADYYSQDAKTFGVPLHLGDVILALDPDGVYCGVAVIGELTGQEGDYLIHVLGDDPKTLEDEGAKEGDKITFILNCVCPEVAPDKWSNQANYRFDVDFRCNHKRQCCDLCYPWNLISFSVIPDNDTLPSVLSTIDGKYERVYTSSCEDGPLSWQSGRPFNDLNNMGPYLGYGLRVTESGLQLCIEGTALPVNTPIALCKDWNFIPYYPDVPDNLDHALASIAGKYIHIFGMECGEVLSWHENRTFNDLVCLRPCLGYFIKMKEAASLVYPAAGYECAADDNSVAGKISPNRMDRVNVTMRFTDFWSGADQSGSAVAEGDLLTVKTQSGVICGECTVGAGGAFLIHVFGDDPQTALVEGARDGELLQFEVNGAPAQVTDGSAIWTERESTRLTVTPATATPVPADYALLQNYPNPFNAGTVIPFAMKNASQWTLTVYNVVGQAIRTFQGYDQAGVVRVTWDGTADGGSSVPSGIYFYRVRTPEWTDAKKMTLLK